MKLKRTTIGLFFRELSDMYQLGIINHIYQAATMYNINIICFSGRFSRQNGSSDTILFAHHRYQRPLFIKGPNGHLEADERYNVFYRALENKKNLIEDPVV